MLKRTEISKVLAAPKIGEEVTVMGWVRAFRNTRFIALNDGSCMKNLQVVVDADNTDESVIKKINFHACIKATGQLVESQGAGQTVEVLADTIEILGEANPEKYPLQPKQQTMEFLREHAHFRMRTNTFSAVFRIRHAIAYAIHKYYNEHGYYYMHTPIITGSDAEGAGEMFHVTSLDLKNPPFENGILDDLALEFYGSIKDSIEKSDNLNLDKINSQIEHLLPGYTLKKLVTAKPSEFSQIIENSNKKELSVLINKIYKKTRRQIFDVSSTSDVAYLKSRVNEILRNVVPINKKNKRFQHRYNLLRRDYPSLALTFYNFLPVHRYNQLSTASKVDYKMDFFGKATNLTVSGQLQAEIAALALGKVYTFGPTFRAENSNTSRHLAEFWMIEPEVAFCDIYGDMDLAEDFVKYLINYVLDNYPDDLAFLDDRIQQAEKNLPKEKRRPMPLVEMLRFVVDNDFERITYTEAIDILRGSKDFKKGRFEYEPVWGEDLQSEHERYLVEKKFMKPVIVRDYPKDIKAFYMRQNDDEKTVAAMDVLFPYIGEVIGGSQREERLEKLEKRIHEMNIAEEELWWYLDLRKFGGAPHAGFGLGFERMVLFITGMGNIRDVIPFPRAPKTAEF